MTTRRRFLSILAGVATFPALRVNASTNVVQWRGIALGAEAQIVLDHPNAEKLIKHAVSEIHRLESIFSLYQKDSQISRLNRDGILRDPAFEMIELLSVCARLNNRTYGAFDPTVQALWSVYAEEFSAGRQPTSAQISQTMQITGWRHINFSPQEVAFDRAGMMLTLNGIAQGFIADKVTAIFSNSGVANVLVNTGEIAASGVAPDGNTWQVKLAGNGNQNISLRGNAVATSAPLGTTFDTDQKVGHILDPRTGYFGGFWSGVSVVSNSAAEADGLSTAFCLMRQPEIENSKGENRVYLH